MKVETLFRRRRDRAAGARHSRLLRFIQREGIEGVLHIVYGHTYRRLEQNTDGVRFTNAGAPIGYRHYSHLTSSSSAETSG
ncbi:metallophosphatase family protein [Akkermansiaceae bacterium]|nr:metallophosphatase family protein [Akkermansiaceae bacterium]